MKDSRKLRFGEISFQICQNFLRENPTKNLRPEFPFKNLNQWFSNMHELWAPLQRLQNLQPSVKKNTLQHYVVARYVPIKVYKEQKKVLRVLSAKIQTNLKQKSKNNEQMKNKRKRSSVVFEPNTKQLYRAPSV